ncbi:MarR family winged helix-turn-helix transcriptional regulator [Propionibacteriaceae bacterium G1746]|uniref:MarR family winged helix-turn-helix transcriptional regulator n=1 Tax=Aestuariimicrobium sp. G57 TaxID=3418485 RepID=UPI003C22076E
MNEVLDLQSPDRDVAVRRLEMAMDQFGRRVRDYYRDACEKFSPGMLPFTFKVLTTIDRLGPVPVSAVADHLVADKGQVSRAVTDLEGRGLVVRTADPTDARVRLVAVPEATKASIAEARAPFSQLLADGLAGFGVDEIDHFTRLLNRLVEGVPTE